MKKIILFIFFIFLLSSSLAFGQNMGSYRVKTMLYISPGGGNYGDGCRNDVNITLIYKDGIVQALSKNLSGISRGQNTYYESNVDVLANRVPDKIQVKSSRNWKRTIGGCGGNGSFNDDLKEGTFAFCTNTYNDIVRWWNDQLTITNVPLLKIKDTGASTLLPINDNIIIESDIGFPSSEYNWQYSLNATTWIDLPQFSGMPSLNTNAAIILGNTNVNSYVNKNIYIRQRATCNAFSNIVTYIIKRYSQANQAALDELSNSSFMPEAGKYIVSGWVKENVAQQQITYSQSNISISIANGNGASFYSETFKPSGAIIDGWQRILGIIEIPAIVAENNPSLEIALNCTNTTADCYFDDIRFFPYNGNLKSFVYDEDTQKLMAELDENNYASFYEYDLEGGLVRVKKETEKGVYTIQETRSNSPKRE
ncbi:hypothetical protein IRZ83_18965 [Flavobacterium sp. JLP]|uniref:hypothetical protein n=1 Tax=Flavobacterium sp. JLP TaxID=2783793 RepID=UPI00188A657D|nr:hypothetical protein [Flavobacterium sp. JLP]MBF4508759.1 hypothetical protein [Flavobacterium sp. JLP]